MSLAILLNRPCTVTHVTQSGAPDEYNNPTDATMVTATVCYIQQRRASEDTTLQDTQREDWMILLPAGTVIDGTDRVTVPDANLILEVQGPPWPAMNPRTQLVSHIECDGKQVI